MFTLLIQTPQHETMRHNDGRYSIHNFDTGRTVYLDASESILLNCTLMATQGRHFDDVLAMWEV